MRKKKSINTVKNVICCEHNHHNQDDGCGCGHNHSHGAEINKKDFIFFKIACGIVFLVLGYVLSEFTEINEKNTAYLLWYIFIL